MTLPSENAEVEKCNLKKEKLIKHFYFKKHRSRLSKKVLMVEGVKMFMGIKMPPNFQ